MTCWRPKAGEFWLKHEKNPGGGGKFGEKNLGGRGNATIFFGLMSRPILYIRYIHLTKKAVLFIRLDF